MFTRRERMHVSRNVPLGLIRCLFLGRLNFKVCVLLLLLALIRTYRHIQATMPQRKKSPMCQRVASGLYHLPANDWRLDEFLSGPIQSPSSKAPCIFQRNKLSLHFPHAMQQLYACWSYWQANREKEPVLFIQDSPIRSWKERFRYLIYSKRNERNPFLKGMIENLSSKLGVKVIEEQTRMPDYAVTVRICEDEGRIQDAGFRMRKGDNKALRDVLTTATPCPTSPRIGVLNRSKDRSILNLEEIVDVIKVTVPEATISTKYFEGISFDDQIPWMSRIDLLVSPHGAQLTSIAFMPDCGGVLEIFPNGYLLPEFFGTLAMASNLYHSYLYLGEGSSTMINNRLVRSQARRTNLCPFKQSVQAGVIDMLKHWNTCCKNRTVS